jgi:hypothetical protein
VLASPKRRIQVLAAALGGQITSARRRSALSLTSVTMRVSGNATPAAR